MILKLLVIACLAESLRGACAKGCLSCSSEDTCIICDISNSYVLAEGACVVSTKTNCQVLSNSDSCVLCKAGYKVDENTGGCVAITTPIANCLEHSTSSCSMCSKGFYFNGTHCATPSPAITNCEYYQNGATIKCSLCGSGQVASEDGKTCAANPVSNCARVSGIVCNECASGTFFNLNFGLRGLQTFVPSAVTNYLNGLVWIYATRGGATVCEPSALENCLEKDSATACKTCSAGYFLDSTTKTCVAFPRPAIANCQVYDSLTTCYSCANRFYLVTSRANCAPVVAVENCVTYKGSETSTVCQECADAYYLSGGACVARTKTVDRCLTKNKNADSCSACQTGYILNTLGDACLPQISNCASYSFSGSGSTASMTCTKCASGFRLSSANPGSVTAACTAGGIANCDEYQNGDGAAVCSLCSASSFADGPTRCTLQPVQANCNTYNPSLEKACSVCVAETFLFTNMKSCAVIPAASQIQNCAAYAEDGTCTRCADRYYLNGNACSAITATNCLQATTSTNCVTCVSGYYVFNGSCFKNLLSITANCDEVVTNSLQPNQNAQNVECYACAAGSLTYKIRGDFCFDSESKLLNSAPLNTDAACAIKSYDSQDCYMCSGGNAVSQGSPDTCVTGSSCSNKVALFELASEGSNKLIYRRNSCSASSLTGCEVWGLNPSTLDLSCSACASNTATYMDLDNTKSNLFGPSATPSNLASTFAPTSRFQKITACLATTTIGSGSASGCKYYASGDNNKGYCQQCPYGQTGTAATPPVEAGTTIKAHFATCADITDCTASSAKQGLDWTGNNYFNCHACNNSKFPVAHIRSTGGFVTDKAANTCETITPIIQFCAFYLFTYNAQNEKTQSCYQCAPGYKLSNGACVAISNCATAGSWPGVCSVCATKSAWPVIEGTVDYATCQLSNAFGENCLVLNMGDVGATECLMCKKGYRLTPIGTCETASLPQCTGATVTLPPSSVSKALFPSLLKLAIEDGGLFGCPTCAAGYTKAIGTYNVCLPSTSLGVSPLPTQLIANCQKYVKNLDITCATCQPGYVLNTLQRKCTQASSNAKLANCQATDEAGANCIACADRFILSSGACVAGEIKNCKVYGQQGACTTCDDGYSLITRTDSTTFCMINPAGLTCLAYDLDDFKQAKLTCTSCPSGQKLATPTFKTTCAAFNKIERCTKYYESSLTEDNSLLCETCAAKSYLSADKKTCKASTDVANCQTYSSSSDACTACNTGFFLSAGKCEENPKGIPGCAEYTDATTCTACEGSTYLSSNTCLPVTTAVANCARYSSATACSVCVSKFYLASNACTAGAISNCLTYSSQTTCTACEGRYYLANNACVAYPDEFCLKISGGSCVSCPNGRYPSGLTCALPTATINNCASYDSATTCNACNVNYYAVTNRTLCLNDMPSYVESGCVNSRQQSSMTCAMCGNGFYVSSTRTCTACPVNANCKQCDPSNPTKCLVCNTSAYMKPDGTCVLNPTPVTDCSILKTCDVKRLFTVFVMFLLAVLL